MYIHCSYLYIILPDKILLNLNIIVELEYSIML